MHTFGDVHIYNDHFAQVEEQLTREPRTLPQIQLNPTITSIDDFTYEDIQLLGYDPHPRIAAQVVL